MTENNDKGKGGDPIVDAIKDKGYPPEDEIMIVDNGEAFYLKNDGRKWRMKCLECDIRGSDTCLSFCWNFSKFEHKNRGSPPNAPEATAPIVNVGDKQSPGAGDGKGELMISWKTCEKCGKDGLKIGTVRHDMRIGHETELGYRCLHCQAFYKEKYIEKKRDDEVARLQFQVEDLKQSYEGFDREVARLTKENAELKNEVQSLDNAIMYDVD